MSRKSWPVARQVEMLTVTSASDPAFKPALIVTNSDPSTTGLCIPVALVWLIVSMSVKLTTW